MRLIQPLAIALSCLAVPYSGATPPAPCAKAPFSTGCETVLRKAAEPYVARAIGRGPKPQLPLSSFAFNYTAKTVVTATTRQVTLDGKVVAKLRPMGNTYVFEQASATGQVMPKLLAALQAAKKRVKQSAVVFAVDGRLPYAVVVSMVTTANRAGMSSTEFLTLDPSYASQPHHIPRQTPFSPGLVDSGEFTWIPAVAVVVETNTVSLVPAEGHTLPEALTEWMFREADGFPLHTLYNRMATVRALRKEANSIQLGASWWTPWADVIAISDATRLRRSAASYADKTSYRSAPLAGKGAYAYTRASLLSPKGKLRLPIPMRVGAPTFSGTCSQDNVKASIARRVGALRVCYREELRAAHKGNATLRWRIAADGRSRSPRVEGLKHAGMRKCLAAIAGRMRFAKKQACKVTVPLVLQGPR